MSESTPIKLPSSAPFPVVVSAILCKPGETVSKHKTIFNYKYWDYQDDPSSTADPPKKIRVERLGTFESPIEGQIDKINISPQDEITHNGIELMFIKEACPHTVQYGGLCALCGKSLEEEKDYSGYNYEDRATIEMSHDSTGLKISYDEAAKIEHSTTDRLIEEKRLILVVDLDQTVIHATVDPTVGEWQLDPSNPNYGAVKDVKSFCLEEEPIVPPGWTGPKLAPTKCTYYVKLRPGLLEFLKRMSEKYEMHIYTMATRNYALAIAKIIDPDGKYFGDRILSRDESGSLTHKNLKRLFPVDQSMVAIIDDRGDVWQWESNLIKVVPYDFFVGIGDINSSFLPKKNGQLTGPTKKRKTIAKLEAAAELSKEGEIIDEQGEIESVTPETEREGEESGSGGSSSIGGSDDDDDAHSDVSTSSPVERILELGGGEGNTTLLLDQSLARNQSIEQQQQDRPLAKLQHDLEQLHEHRHDGTDSKSESGASEDESDDDDNLLLDDDNELVALDKVLVNIHSEYYKRYSKENKPDLTEIIPNMKSRVLEGITVLFSGIIPLGINLDSADIVIWCKQFGVKVVNEVYPDVTHVICRDVSEDVGPTFKARVARKLYPDTVKIVNPDWLFACLSNWTIVDEKEYLVSTDNPKLWKVQDPEVDKYKRLVEEKSNMAEATHIDSIESFDEYDLDEANQEVDDFLAGLSDDDDDDEDDDENENAAAANDLGSPNGVNYAEDDEDNGNKVEDDEEKEEEASTTNGHDSFIKNLYSNKKRPLELDEDEDEGDDADAESNGESASKKQKVEMDEEFLDDLEKELLDGFDDLEE
ncbi:RNA polymerase II subunit A C-terminal domain phosphatase [Candida viswanathii]|uniref:RNA polymerase II subunit A C-terminal domain phosphatase n=1 Tax=Candida viswanathii TaxID=5486 RepID=A0A367XZ03_9ASCO|nr:RNA polymerase II subunit A C-terminal domain phosphatase [Candida viswanathii]